LLLLSSLVNFNYCGLWVFSLWIALFGRIVDWEWFQFGLHYLGLLFAKSIVNWCGVMSKLPFPQRVAKTTGGEIVFLVGEKMVNSGLGGVVGPRRWAATPWVLGADSCAWPHPKLQTPGTGAAKPWALGSDMCAWLQTQASRSEDPPPGVCRQECQGLQNHMLDHASGLNSLGFGVKTQGSWVLGF